MLCWLDISDYTYKVCMYVLYIHTKYVCMYVCMYDYTYQVCMYMYDIHCTYMYGRLVVCWATRSLEHGMYEEEGELFSERKKMF